MVDYEDNSKECLNNVNVALKDGLQQVLLYLEGEAKQRCPVGNGTLRASITTSINDVGEKLVGTVGTNLDYAIYIHQGTGIKAPLGRQDVPWIYYNLKTGEFVSTSGIEPNPFMLDTLNANRTEIAAFLANEMRNA